MKKLVVIMLMAFIGFGITTSKAQININIGSQPVWGPTGYDHVDYYYLPDIESYYDVPKRQYVYQSGNQWIHSNNLPTRYANYNVNKGYKVVLNEPTPFMHFNDDKIKYAKFKGYKVHQDFIRYSNDPKYYVVKGHPKYNGNNKYGDKHDGTIGHENNGKGNKGMGNGSKGKSHGNKEKEHGNEGKGNNGKGHGKG